MGHKRSIGMLVAVEMDSIFARYGTPGAKEKRGGFDVYRFENEEYVLYVIHSGIGELAAAAATELLTVANVTFIEEYAKDCAKTLSKLNDKIEVSLHRINFSTDREINYQLEDLCSK